MITLKYLLMFASVVLNNENAFGKFYKTVIETFIYDGPLQQNSGADRPNARRWRVVDFTDYAIFDIIVLVCLFIQKSLLQV